MFYLTQSRVVVMIILTVFFLSLILAIYVIGTPPHAKQTYLCPEWSQVVPDATTRCPPSEIQVFYPEGAITKGKQQTSAENVANAPLAIFLPHSQTGYYYSVIVVEPTSAIQKLRLIGMATNVQLAETAIFDRGSWIVEYQNPNPGPASGETRVIFLLYRHRDRFDGNIPVTRNNFNVETWIHAEWKSNPELVGANYFTMRGT